MNFSSWLTLLLIPCAPVDNPIITPEELDAALRACDAVLLGGMTLSFGSVDLEAPLHPELGSVSWEGVLASDGTTWCMTKQNPMYSTGMPTDEDIAAYGTPVDVTETGFALTRPHKYTWLYANACYRSMLVSSRQHFNAERQLSSEEILDHLLICEWPRLSESFVLTAPPFHEVMLATGRGFSLYIANIVQVTAIEDSDNVLALVDSLGGGQLEFVVQTNGGFLVRELREITDELSVTRIRTDGIIETSAGLLAQSGTFYSLIDPMNPVTAVTTISCVSVADTSLIGEISEAIGGQLPGPSTYIDFVNAGQVSEY